MGPRNIIVLLSFSWINTFWHYLRALCITCGYRRPWFLLEAQRHCQITKSALGFSQFKHLGFGQTESGGEWRLYMAPREIPLLSLLTYSWVSVMCPKECRQPMSQCKGKGSSITAHRADRRGEVMTDCLLQGRTNSTQTIPTTFFWTHKS